jgi:AraC-like DNA-binding protein
MREIGQDPTTNPVVGTRADFDYPPVPLDGHRPYDRIRELYVYEEPGLLAALGRGDRSEAIRIINYILVHVYAAGQERSDLLKGLLLELVVMMSRAAIAAGSSPSEVLGLNYQSLTELAGIDDDEGLAHWLRTMFDRVSEAMSPAVEVARPAAVTQALGYMRGSLHLDVNLTETAHLAGVSPRHLSRLLREHTGRSFTQLLREARIERASELLATSDESLATIADLSGFCDQAYFTHVFQRARHMTPRLFREAHRR